MKIIANLSKDVSKVELYEATDIASLGIWDKAILSSYSYQDLSDASKTLIPNNAVLVNTGSDGNFKVSLYLNSKISEEDTKNIYKKVLGIKLSTKGSLFVGSPEWVGTKQNDGVTKNFLDELEIVEGNYIINAYSLLIRDAQGKPKYLQFTYEIFEERKFPYKDIPLDTVATPLELKY
jgi:hypothetical protein